MANEKKCFLDYSSDNGMVGFRLLIENNHDNKITFFTLNENEEPSLFASIFMAAKEVKNSSLVVRDHQSGLDFFLPNGDKLFISYVEAPELGLDPDDEEDPEKVRALPTPKPKPIHHFLFLSLIPTPESKARGKITLPTLSVHRDALAAAGESVAAELAETSEKNNPKKSFAWGTVAGTSGKTVLLGWMSGEEARGTLEFVDAPNANPTCSLHLEYPEGGAFHENKGEIFALGLFDDTKTALAQGSHLLTHGNPKKGISRK